MTRLNHKPAKYGLPAFITSPLGRGTIIKIIKHCNYLHQAGNITILSVCQVCRLDILKFIKGFYEIFRRREEWLKEELDFGGDLNSFLVPGLFSRIL